ncbi:MAG: DUF6502 family protein [Ideonella sp.]|nr:DUF6502 family protein [Ideonella sp.]
MSNAPDSSLPPDQQALLEAVNAVLLPLATLAVARGVHFSVIEERLRQAFVQAAREANPGGLPHRQVSRISTTTGINRREVTRLINTSLHQERPRRSLAAEVYAHWLTNTLYRDAEGLPLPLKRQGPKPSFETLAREITSDVHPRSLLGEMVRLGYAVLDEPEDLVVCVMDALVPKGNMPRSLRILGDNVGAHFAAAAINVLATEPQHFERAVVATGIPRSKVAELRQLLQRQWRVVQDAMVPELESMINDEHLDPTEPKERLLIGLYSHHRAMPPEQDGNAEPEPKG